MGQFPTPEIKAERDRWNAWLLANRDGLGIKYLIGDGKFFSDATGWRGQTYNGGGVYDPASATGGHFDHIHASFRDQPPADPQVTTVSAGGLSAPAASGYGYGTAAGILFSAEDLALWRQRAQTGPYRVPGDAGPHSPGDWQRIVANAEDFRREATLLHVTNDIPGCLSEQNMGEGWKPGSMSDHLRGSDGHAFRGIGDDSSRGVVHLLASRSSAGNTLERRGLCRFPARRPESFGTNPPRPR